jgi:hypothetical protein
MDEVPQNVDGEELDLPLNQQPGTAAPEIEINYEVERRKEEQGTESLGIRLDSAREPDNRRQER